MTTERHPGLILAVARFYYDPRSAFLGMWASTPGEARLFAYLMVACALVLIERFVRVSADVSIPPEDLAPALVAQVVSIFFFVPLFFYGQAAFVGLVVRALGRRAAGVWRDARGAVFWAALVSAPVQLALTLGALAVDPLDNATGVAARSLGAVFYGYAWLFCLGTVFEKRRICIAALVLGGVGAAAVAWQAVFGIEATAAVKG